MFEDFIIKYCWSATGYVVSSVPVFRPDLVRGRNQGKTKDEKAGEHTKSFITNKRLMIALADAGGRILYSYKELAELAGRTVRVYNLLSVLHAVHVGKSALIVDKVHGRLEKGCDFVRFEDTPIVVPGHKKDILIKNLNIEVRSGEHLMITGSNGVGKTGIARILSGIWPVFGSFYC